jgi:ATP dependent DNA ligase domain
MRARRRGRRGRRARPRGVRRSPLSAIRDHAAILCAFDLIELDGEDLRWHPLEQRKAALADLLGQVEDGVVYNEHFTRDSAIIFRHACALGCEGIVSKRLGSFYRSDRVDHWLQIKNPAAPAVKARPKRIGEPSDGRAGGIAEMTHVTPFFGFALALVIPGALVMLLAALLWTGET